MKPWICIGACIALGIGNHLASGIALAGQGGSAAKTLKVEPLTAADTRGLSGELRCSFTDAEDRVLLLGAGYVGDSAPPTGVVRISGAPVSMNGKESGGFEALMAGPDFTNGQAVTATIDRAAQQQPEDGVENSKWTADLLVSKADGGKASFENGVWTCGP